MHPEGFWRFVQIGEPSACWPWLGGTSSKGYGRWHNQQAHRVSYEAIAGPIPAGLHIDHLCRNPGCVNPAHMEPVTPKENALRGIGPSAVNATKTHCARGHPYDEENTIQHSARGRPIRRCKMCHQENNRRYWKRRRARETALSDGETHE